MGLLWRKDKRTLLSDIYLSHSSYSKIFICWIHWMNVYEWVLTLWHFFEDFYTLAEILSFIFLIIYFLNLIIYFYSVTLVCIFSPSQFHICGPYIGSTQSASVGTLTPQKNANNRVRGGLLPSRDSLLKSHWERQNIELDEQ